MWGVLSVAEELGKIALLCHALDGLRRASLLVGAQVYLEIDPVASHCSLGRVESIPKLYQRLVGRELYATDGRGDVGADPFATLDKAGGEVGSIVGSVHDVKARAFPVDFFDAEQNHFRLFFRLRRFRRHVGDDGKLVRLLSGRITLFFSSIFVW